MAMEAETVDFPLRHQDEAIPRIADTCTREMLSLPFIQQPLSEKIKTTIDATLHAITLDYLVPLAHAASKVRIKHLLIFLGLLACILEPRVIAYTTIPREPTTATYGSLACLENHLLASETIGRYNRAQTAANSVQTMFGTVEETLHSAGKYRGRSFPVFSLLGKAGTICTRSSSYLVTSAAAFCTAIHSARQTRTQNETRARTTQAENRNAVTEQESISEHTTTQKPPSESILSLIRKTTGRDEPTYYKPVGGNTTISVTPPAADALAKNSTNYVIYIVGFKNPRNVIFRKTTRVTHDGHLIYINSKPYVIHWAPRVGKYKPEELVEPLEDILTKRKFTLTALASISVSAEQYKIYKEEIARVLSGKPLPKKLARNLRKNLCHRYTYGLVSKRFNPRFEKNTIWVPQCDAPVAFIRWNRGWGKKNSVINRAKLVINPFKKSKTNTQIVNAVEKTKKYQGYKVTTTRKVL